MDSLQNLVKNEIYSLFKTVPQMLTSPVSISFVLDMVDFRLTDPEWQKLDPNSQDRLVAECLSELENEKLLESSVKKMKGKRVFVSTGDDAEIPNLPNNVRFYSLKR